MDGICVSMNTAIRLLCNCKLFQSAQKKIRSIVQRGKNSPGLSSGYLPGFGDPHVNAFPNGALPASINTALQPSATLASAAAAGKLGSMSLGSSAAPGAPSMSVASAQLAAMNNSASTTSAANAAAASIVHPAESPAANVVNVPPPAFGQFGV